MVADIVTPRLQLLMQGVGNNNNAWGQNLNDQVISLIDQAVAGVTVINITNAVDLTVTADQSRYATIVFTGTPGASKNIFMPATEKKWTIINKTTGAGFLIFRVTGGVGDPVNAPQGMSVDFVSDGSTIFRKGAEKVGEIFYYGGTTAPAGALECNNGAYKRAEVVDLFRSIGTTWGSTDLSDFKVPPGNDTGRYIRGRTGSLAVGTVQANQNKSHTHTGSGTTGNQSSDHNHTGSGTTSIESANHYHIFSGSTGGNSANHSHSYSGSTATESASHTHNYWGSPGTSSSPGGNFATGAAPSNLPTTAESAYHYHTYSGGTGNESSSHYHSYSGSTGNPSVNHTHTYSFTTSGISASHTHSYSFTTSTGSADGTESRPESIVGIMCIRY